MTTRGFWGGLLVVIGCLIAVLSGGCTLFMIISGGGLRMLFPIILIIGGAPFLVGLGLFFWGRKIRNNHPDDVSDHVK